MRNLDKRMAYLMIYVVSVALIYLILVLKQRIISPLAMALIMALFGPILYFVITLAPKNIITEGLSRYTMKCKNCNWEWMSNITEKVPESCPRCHKNNVDIIGWRKIEMKEIKGDKTLQEFFK